MTRTFEVKIGLIDPPEGMRLGATVTGRLTMDAAPVIEILASALTRVDRQPAVWVVDPVGNTVLFAQCRRAALRSDEGRRLARTRYRRDRDYRGVQALHPATGAAARCAAMTRFNVSEWALNHRSLVVYLMIVTTAAGLLSYSRLGRNEDPLSPSAPWWCRLLGPARRSTTRLIRH